MIPIDRSSIRRDALRLFLDEPGLEVHPRELARRLDRAAPPVVRELNRLEQHHILTSRMVGPLRRYRLADTPEARAMSGSKSPRPSSSEWLDPRSHDGRLLLLHARVARELRHAPERVVAKARENIRRWQELNPRSNRPWIEAWTEILDRHPSEVALLLTDESARMRELRQSSPFAGVLTPAERRAVLREGRTS
jgi:DNA-binding transcriptional ArsR family regulator